MFWSLFCLAFSACLFYYHHIYKDELENNKAQLKTFKKALLITAHPDDECMFFSPTILQLRKQGIQIYILCLSTGNADGLGHIRSKELLSSASILGLDAQHVSIKDLDQLQDGPRKWKSEFISTLIKEFVQMHSIDMIITFDGYGISGHLNHISIYHGLMHYIHQESAQNIKPKCYTLESVSIFRKFTFLFDILSSTISMIRKREEDTLFMMCTIQDYLIARNAMFAHQSQLVWFRHLYLSFSRYMLMNDLHMISSITNSIKKVKKAH